MGDEKYKAFISYSHADEAWAGWLQRALEHFRAPGTLAAALTAAGKSPRLAPVFRDRADLPVAGDLNAAIKTALAASAFQIVLCSPAAARSRWVNEEIKLFHRLHGPGRVFALIIGGEPGASFIAGRAEEECFPPALRHRLGADGEITSDRAEPLAADARKSGDGKRYAFLKLAAGMLGVGLDDLIRRDAARRAKAAWMITGASVAATAATGALAFYAVAKGNEAAMMRGKAENLIEFMLTDLKDRLEPVGRLDVLEAVGDRAMDYYAGQNLQSLDDDALARRAKAMLLLGSIDFRRNDLGAARDAYESAERATGELMRRAPDDADRVFDHAQAVFYVGETAGAGGDMDKAERQLLEYHRLAERLIGFNPDDPKWRLEVAYATSNLGVLKFKAGDYDEAIRNFEKSAAARRTLSDAAPGDRRLADAYASALSWWAFAEWARGDFRRAVELIERQLAVYAADADGHSENFSTLDFVVVAQRRLVNSLIGLGDIGRARIAAAAAADTASRLLARDPRRANWIVNASHIARIRSHLFELEGDEDAARESAQRALMLAESVAERESGDEVHRIARALALARCVDIGGDAAKTERAATDLRRLSALLANSSTLDALGARATITLTLARRERSEGREDRAQEVAAAALPALEAGRRRIFASDRIALAQLYLEAGAVEKATEIIADLDRMGVRHPDLLAAKQDVREFAEN